MIEQSESCIGDIAKFDCLDDNFTGLLIPRSFFSNLLKGSNHIIRTEFFAEIDQNGTKRDAFQDSG